MTERSIRPNEAFPDWPHAAEYFLGFCVRTHPLFNIGREDDGMKSLDLMFHNTRFLVYLKDLNDGGELLTSERFMPFKLLFEDELGEPFQDIVIREIPAGTQPVERIIYGPDTTGYGVKTRADYLSDTGRYLGKLWEETQHLPQSFSLKSLAYIQQEEGKIVLVPPIRFQHYDDRFVFAEAAYEQIAALPVDDSHTMAQAFVRGLYD